MEHADLPSQALKACPMLDSLEKAQHASKRVSERTTRGRRPIEAVMPELASQTLRYTQLTPLPRTTL
jgi:hypothetical protein